MLFTPDCAILHYLLSFLHPAKHSLLYCMED